MKHWGDSPPADLYDDLFEEGDPLNELIRKDRMSENQIDDFDRLLGNLTGLNDVTHTRPATVTTLLPLIGIGTTVIVQTFRQRDRDDENARSRDTLFLQVLNAKQSLRIVLPPEAADAIARQRESLTLKARVKRGREAAAARKASGAPNPLQDPAVRAKALAARKAKRRKKGAK